jgi:hypothetical protein
MIGSFTSTFNFLPAPLYQHSFLTYAGKGLVDRKTLLRQREWLPRTPAFRHWW